MTRFDTTRLLSMGYGMDGPQTNYIGALSASPIDNLFQLLVSHDGNAFSLRTLI